MGWILFFLKNPLGRLVLMGMLWTASLGFVGVKYYYKGRAQAELEAKVERLESQLAVKEADLRIARDSENAVIQYNIDLNNDLQTANEEIAEYENSIKNDTNPRLTKRDADVINKLLGNH